MKDKNCNKVCLINLGCKVNKYESDCMVNLLEQSGYKTTYNNEYADYYIVNTCAVTAEAEKKSRQTISKILKLNNNAKIIICGCASVKNKTQFENKPNVIAVIGNSGKGKIVDIIEGNAKIDDDITGFSDLKNPAKSQTRSYLKIQDGCNNFCSYCIIPYLRGRSKSRDINEIIDEAYKLAEDTNEIVITGIDISSFKINGTGRNVCNSTGSNVCNGTDNNIYNSADKNENNGADGIKFEQGLPELLKSLKYVPARIRLSSLEVNCITKQLLDTVKNMQNFCEHFHLSLQSGSNSVLKKMNRKYTGEEYLNKVELIRKYFPNANITTDVITGFADESEQEFEETTQLIIKAKFGDIHIFPYSPRESTMAYRFNNIDKSIRKLRASVLQQLADKMKLDYIKRQFNKTEELLVEEEVDKYFSGFSRNYIKCYLPQVKNIKNGDIVKIVIKEPFLDGCRCELAQ